MKNEKINDESTGIRADVIDRTEADTFQKPRVPWRKYCAIAAAFVLLLGVGVFAFGCLRNNAAPGSQSGANTGRSYMSYAGPVFPLTTLGESAGLTAQRSISFDFSPYASFTETFEHFGETLSYDRFNTEAIVMDDYTLTNTTAQDIALTAVYPFAGSFFDGRNTLPAISVDGETVPAALHAGSYTGGFTGAGDAHSTSMNLDNIDSWEGYKALIENGYIDSAFDPWPVLTQPVAVYELSDRTAPADTDAVNPTLNMTFRIDFSKTSLLTYGMNGGSQDVIRAIARAIRTSPRISTRITAKAAISS